jgi:microcystin-dependent protein
MPKAYTTHFALPYPSTGDMVFEGDDILRELVARLEVVIGPPSGSAGGDLGENYPNPRVVTIAGRAASAVVFTDDPRLSDTRAPAGAAGGDLGGNYPNPTVAKVNGRAATAVVFTDDARLSPHGIPPIGFQGPYAGSGDPAGGDWLLCDGRLIDRTVYAAFFAAVGHAYNGGVDPGANMVRLPDKRGRGSIGAINMGTAAGAGPNTNARAQVARGAGGGEAAHILSIAEMPSHDHDRGFYGDGLTTSPGGSIWGNAEQFAERTGLTGGSGAHNNLGPYETDNWIVRVL